jgi:hypothetical protein
MSARTRHLAVRARPGGCSDGGRPPGGISEPELAHRADASAGTPLRPDGVLGVRTSLGLQTDLLTGSGQGRQQSVEDLQLWLELPGRQQGLPRLRVLGPRRDQFAPRHRLVLRHDPLPVRLPVIALAGGLAARSDAREPFVAWGENLGLGVRTGIDLRGGESIGRIPDRSWKKQTWDDTKVESCARVRSGYPHVAKTDPARAPYLKAVAIENCRPGFQLRAGDEATSQSGRAMWWSRVAVGIALCRDRHRRDAVTSPGRRGLRHAPADRPRYAVVVAQGAAMPRPRPPPSAGATR